MLCVDRMLGDPSEAHVIVFFDTEYLIRYPLPEVYACLSDFKRYLMTLPEFYGAKLSTDTTPIESGKVYWISVPDGDYAFRTRLELIDVSAPDQLVYDYQYTGVDSDTPLSAKEGPMPWDRARMTLTFEACDTGTRVRARMQVFGVEGFFARWKVNALKTTCARAQKSANDNMVRVVENVLKRETTHG